MTVDTKEDDGGSNDYGPPEEKCSYEKGEEVSTPGIG